MTNGRWKLPDGSGHIKKAMWSNHFSLNLVKQTLQIGNQPGSTFVTLLQLYKFHSLMKIPYHRKTYDLLNSQPQSYHMQTGLLSNKYTIQHDITNWHPIICVNIGSIFSTGCATYTLRSDKDVSVVWVKSPAYTIDTLTCSTTGWCRFSKSDYTWWGTAKTSGVPILLFQD